MLCRRLLVSARNDGKGCECTARGNGKPSKTTILLLGVEAGTGFVGETPVAIDFRIGIAFFEHGHQLEEGLLLFGRARVGRTPVGIEATDVAHPDAVGIVPTAMSAYAVGGSALVDRPVQVNHIMIAYALPSPRLVPAVDVVDGHLHSRWCGGTMDDDGVDAPPFIGQNCFQDTHISER